MVNALHNPYATDNMHSGVDLEIHVPKVPLFFGLGASYYYSRDTDRRWLREGEVRDWANVGGGSLFVGVKPWETGHHCIGLSGGYALAFDVHLSSQADRVYSDHGFLVRGRMITVSIPAFPLAYWCNTRAIVCMLPRPTSFLSGCRPVSVSEEKVLFGWVLTTNIHVLWTIKELFGKHGGFLTYALLSSACLVYYFFGSRVRAGGVIMTYFISTCGTVFLALFHPKLQDKAFRHKMKVLLMALLCWFCGLVLLAMAFPE